jgi:hypothetical protein
VLAQLEPPRAFERLNLRGQERHFLPLARQRRREAASRSTASIDRGASGIWRSPRHKPTPTIANNPATRLVTRVRTRLNVETSRCGCRRASSCSVGMCTTNHSFLFATEIAAEYREEPR